ncbi:YpiF family protein [Virgibacillus sediminis]|uniref:YpiF family protein n=1 Tax=Virgibacillus sediminis TaxID=202260 RepID=A0ABV7A652_9BACI
MKWSAADLPRYIEAKEYIDTVMIPLIPFQLSNDKTTEKVAFQNELLSILANEIEKELTGRMMLSPPYHYRETSVGESEIVRLNGWVEEVREQPFNHIFFITFDSTWKKAENTLDGSVLWFPGSQSGDLSSNEMKRQIRDQVGQITELIRSYWS